MSDLQCPARVFVFCPGDPEKTDEAARTLASERVVQVWSGRAEKVTSAAATIASALDVPVITRDEEAGRLVDVLAEAVDLFRGEAVLLISQDPPPGVAEAQTGALFSLKGDADGWATSRIR